MAKEQNRLKAKKMTIWGATTKWLGKMQKHHLWNQCNRNLPLKPPEDIPDYAFKKDPDRLKGNEKSTYLGNFSSKEPR